MNNVTLIGRLTHEPKLIHRGDRPICEMRLAVDNHKHEPTYIDVRTFDGRAYACAEFLGKGRRVGVNGRLIYNEWRDGEDKKHERYSVIGHVEFLEPLSTSHEEPQAEPEDPSAQAKVAELLAA
jgi:single-strand DNA-binding protein